LGFLCVLLSLNRKRLKTVPKKVQKFPGLYYPVRFDAAGIADLHSLELRDRRIASDETTHRLIKN